MNEPSRDLYVVDTHGLVWFMAEDARLSPRGEALLRQAEEAAGIQVLVPTVVLAEAAYIAEKRRVEIGIGEVIERVSRSDGYAIVPFDFPVVKAMLELPRALEMHDRIIVATARHYEAELITRDEAIRASGVIRTVW